MRKLFEILIVIKQALIKKLNSLHLQQQPKNRREKVTQIQHIS